MTNLMLQSNAGGTWEYEISEKPEGSDREMKVKYPIKPGFNEIPASHIATLEKDHGYVTMVKQEIYKIIKSGKELADAKSGASSDEKALEVAKNAEEAKILYKGKISELKTAHVGELKKEKDIYQAEYQKLIDSRGEALQKVKALEDEKIVLLGKISELEAGAGQDVKLLEEEVSGLKADAEKQTKDHDSAVTALKTESQKQIKALEGKNGSLETKVKEQSEQIKTLKKK